MALFSVDEAKKYEFTISTICKMIPKGKAEKPAYAMLHSLIELKSEPRDYLGKVLAVKAGISITEDFKNSDKDYSFRLDDGTAVLFVYMDKAGAGQQLRNLLIAGSEKRGTFVFFLDPGGYIYLGEIYGKLVSYQVIK
nr:hypothetical protein [uncultured bacterium]